MSKTTDQELKKRAIHAEIDKARKILEDAGCSYILTVVKRDGDHVIGNQTANVNGKREAAYLLEKTSDTIHEIGEDIVDTMIKSCECSKCEEEEKEELEDVDEALKEKRVKYAFENFLEKLNDMVK